MKTFTQFLEQRDPELYEQMLNEGLADVYNYGKSAVQGAWQGTKDFFGEFWSRLKEQFGEFSDDAKKIKQAYSDGKLTPVQIKEINEASKKKDWMRVAKILATVGVIVFTALSIGAGHNHAGEHGPIKMVDKDGNPIDNDDQFTSQHNTFMQKHYKQSAETDKHLDDFDAKKNAEQDAKFLKDNLTGDEESDKYVRNILKRTQQARNIEGTPSQQVNSKAFMANAEMDLDAKDPSKIGHEHAKAGNYEQWKKSKELEDFMNSTKIDDVLKKQSPSKKLKY